MQLFFLPEWQMILLFFVLWFCFQFGAAWFCFCMSDSYFLKDSFLYQTRSWEKKSNIYKKLKVKRWKKYLPDGGGLFKGGYAKRQLKDFSTENLNKFLIESRRAELTHWLAICPFWVFGFFAPLHVVWIMLVYALVVNMPCIIAQRYNRPRIMELLSKKNKMNSENQ